jgi:DNA-binding CsgD family transcriptional regulator
MDFTDCIVPDIDDLGILDDELKHYGTLMESGRFPWGSGEHPYQRLKDFHSAYMRMKQDGLKPDKISAQFGISTNVLKARVALYTDLTKTQHIAECSRLAEQGMSNVAIAKKLGISEGAVRNYLKKTEEARTASVVHVMDAIRDQIGDGGFVQVGAGTEARMNINKTKLDAAVINLQDEGYVLYSDIRAKMGGSGNYTTLKVLAAPGVTKRDIYDNPEAIKIMNCRSEEGNASDPLKKIEPPTNISSSRITVRYADDDVTGMGDGQSGAARDGLIELRRGVEDLNLGNAHYAQVRIAVDGKAYAKGMAVYSDDLPDGVDIRINSNRKRGTPLYSDDPDAKTVLKPQNRTKDGEIDEENPFSAAIKDEQVLRMVQAHYIGADGKEHLSALNIVNEEGDWERWSRNLPSQFLSKQKPELAKKQLDLDTATRRSQYEELMQITNPVLKEQMLIDFAQKCDSAAEVLKAASLPRQQQHVILPLPELKPNEIYAPNYRDGEQVALVRYPHGGTFEIPVLTVNNRNRTGKKLIGTDARDAVGIHPEAAQQLSGADFDGDSVAVIPLSSADLKTKKPLPGLRDFDTKAEYSTTEADRQSGAVKIIKTQQQSDTEMGKITNLITDMSLTGTATDEELERAVRHSMVIIDAKKHKLDYTRSAQDNGIAELKKKYQARIDPETGKVTTGAGTIVSRASSQYDVPKRRSYMKSIDPETGAAIYEETGETKWKKHTDKKTGEITWENAGLKTMKSTKMRETDDAYTLTSGGSKANPGTQMEALYAEYANAMKAMANRARKETLSIAPIQVSPTAKQTFAPEIAHLKAEVNNAKKNAPLEKKAQMLAQRYVSLIKADEPLSKEEESKQLDKALKRARKSIGAERYEIKLTDREWEAIQSGAVPKTTQKEIFRFVDDKELMRRALPRDRKKPDASVIAAMKSMLARGYTSEEVADRFAISTTTLHNYIDEQ